ncbi:MAG TPA: choice-of-anchor A family protein, partial [Ruminococcus flavefaciens]|nr:choice-of-anchor A family protein [Ruminococcus flavefaciens]
MRKTLGKRMISGITSALLAVTYVLPQSMGRVGRELLSADAVSERYMVPNVYGQDANNGYSPKALSQATLLVGDGSPLAALDGSAKKSITNARNTYFLGIASQFGIFLEENMEVNGADAEGRVAVGGNLTFAGNWNYQVGNGDYATMAALIDVDEYSGITNFAHAIVGGDIANINVFGASDKDGGRGGLWHGNTAYYPEDEDRYKRFVFQNGYNEYDAGTGTGSYHLGPDGTKFTPYGIHQHDDLDINETAAFYEGTLIDFPTEFAWLEERGNELAKIEPNGTVEKNGGTLNLTYDGPPVDTIYFYVPEWKDTSQVVISGDGVRGTENYVISCPTEEITMKGNVETKILDKVISNTGGVSTNNSAESSQILYNFYKCTDLNFGGNMNGTLFAPLAAARSNWEGTEGHLSGALIAKSYRGSMEFGYRPYLGPVDILGVTSSYIIDAYKFGPDGTTPLAGAEIGLYEIALDDSGNIIMDGDEPEMTLVDFAYSNENGKVSIPVSEDGYYCIKEITPPAGYALSDEAYYFKVKDSSTENKVKYPTGSYYNAEIKIYDAADAVSAAGLDSGATVKELEEKGYIAINAPKDYQGYKIQSSDFDVYNNDANADKYGYFTGKNAKVNSVTLYYDEEVEKTVYTDTISFPVQKQGDGGYVINDTQSPKYIASNNYSGEGTVKDIVFNITVN